MKAYDYGSFLSESSKKRSILGKKYNLNEYGVDPCSIGDIKGLKWVTKEIIQNLFPYDDYEYYRSFESDDGSYEVVEFYFNEELMSFKRSKKMNSLSLDYYDRIKYLLLFSESNYSIARINPDGTIVSGELDNLRNAQREGFPLSLEEEIKLYGNLSNSQIDRNTDYEIYVPFEEESIQIDIERLEIAFICGLKEFNRLNTKVSEYTKEQIKIIYDSRKKTFGIIVNGDSTGSNSRRLDKKTMIFEQRKSAEILVYGLLEVEDIPSIELRYPNNEKVEKMTKFEYQEHIKKLIVEYN